MLIECQAIFWGRAFDVSIIVRESGKNGAAIRYIEK
jgi:hypothetical protein